MQRIKGNKFPRNTGNSQPNHMDKAHYQGFFFPELGNQQTWLQRNF
jgi:hypothetical protein